MGNVAKAVVSHALSLFSWFFFTFFTIIFIFGLVSGMSGSYAIQFLGAMIITLLLVGLAYYIHLTIEYNKIAKGELMYRKTLAMLLKLIGLLMIIINGYVSLFGVFTNMHILSFMPNFEIFCLGVILYIRSRSMKISNLEFQKMYLSETLVPLTSEESLPEEQT